MSLRIDRNAATPLRIRRNFQRMRFDALSADNFTFNEVPAGVIDGVNVTYTLAQNPNPATSLQLFKNGLLLRLTTDYTLSGSTVTMVVAPTGGSYLQAHYLTR